MKIQARQLFTSLALVQALGFASLGVARADISGGAGIWSQTGGSKNSTGTALMISTGKAVPATPAQVQFTGLIPLTNNGGYAATAELRAGALGTYAGAGAGVGQLGGNNTSGVLTAFVGTHIAPLTSLELRGYKETRSSGASALFAGARFSL